MQDEILDAKEVAALLKLHPRTVSNMADRGDLPGFKLGGKWRFRKADIEDHIQRLIDQQQQGKGGEDG